MNESLLDECLFPALRSLRNGLELGARIRATHCIVMTLLYRRDKPLLKNAQFILSATKEHSLNLGAFAFLFKITRYVLTRKLNVPEGKASFVAGLVVGYLVWGRSKTPINLQIVLYLISRDLAGLSSELLEQEKLPVLSYYPLVASLTWAVVMGLHSVSAKHLQDGLRSSMDFLYKDDSHWKLRGNRNWKDFIPFSGT